eukprot:TRINITY_DN8485_c0_g1_i4.p1 TRINITY_DN8485_c0_g1~~TRINITY_DN8485_c0_g1_i4.p1  ORF type:complete len:546 (-),score=103.62 TRINITY_DN8485_c0_g1_i4:248-1885(-)
MAGSVTMTLNPESSLSSSNIHERNTFLHFAPPPAPLTLMRSKTDPPPGLGKDDDIIDGDDDQAPLPLPLEYLSTPDAFEDFSREARRIPPATGQPWFLEQSGPSSSQEKLGGFAPGLPALEKITTNDGYGPAHPGMDNMDDPPPPGLPLEKLETYDGNDGYGPAQPGADDPPPPGLPLEKLETYDGFGASSALGLPALEKITTNDGYGPAQPGADDPPPPGLLLEKLETYDGFGASSALGLPALEKITTHDGYGLAHPVADDPPPAALPLEKLDTYDGFGPGSSLGLPALEKPTPFAAFQPSYVTPFNFGACEHVPPPEQRPRQTLVLDEVIIPDSTMSPHLALGTPQQLPPPPFAPAPVVKAASIPAPPAAPPVEDTEALPPSGDLAANMIKCTDSTGGGSTYVHWAVDAKKLYSTDARIVSPQFMINVPEYGPLPFKVSLHAKLVINNKRGGGFKKAKGKGSVELKCEAPHLDSSLELAFTIRCGRGATLQPPRGPILNNFTEKSCAGLPEGKDEWDFRSIAEGSGSGCLLVSVHVQFSQNWQ